jgi:hypothetical protein
MSQAARRARRDRPPRHVPTIAVAGQVDVRTLRAAGWQLRGRLQSLPYDDPLDAEPYTHVGELVEDARLDAVAVDGTAPELAALLPELRDAGLLLLLPAPAPLDPEVLRAARGVPDAADAAVGLVRRWEPWAVTVRAALPLAGGPPLQVTVRGWPRGAVAAAELVDLVTGWCGDIAAVVAAPAPLPAAVLPVPGLPAGAPVAWALLTASGATVLVSHQGGPPLVRVSFATARLQAGPTGARWEGGQALPLLEPPEWVPRAQAAHVGLVATAAALAAAVGTGALPPPGWPSGSATDPRPADLGDLLVVARVLEALRTSARTESLVPIA